MRKNSYITVTDQFCGAGGSSLGVKNFASRNGGGVEVKLALNHWALAIETHSTNFPDTLHDCTDISACDPKRYPSTDILITSPECTNHSVAKGKKALKNQMDMFSKGVLDASAERSRATMWDVVRFAEQHNYNVIITENVVDARKWVMFESWIHAMQALGYNFKCCFLNSMHFWPTPQSRDRMYVVFWKRGNKAPDLNYYPLANCKRCEKDVNAVQSWKPKQKSWKYKQGYVYCCPNCSTIVEPYFYAAFNCIDWSIPGTRIGDRNKPLVPKTEKRIRYGLNKYGSDPFVFPTNYSDQARGIVKSVASPLNTQTTFAASQAIVTQPFIINTEQASQPPNSYVRSAFDSFQTQATRQTFGVLTPPLIINNKGYSTASSSLDAINTQTTMRNNGILSAEPFNTFLSYYNSGSDQASHITDAMGTLPTGDRVSIVNYSNIEYEDCFYRTIKAHEVKLGMAINSDYEIKGDSKEQVRQCGNAVTPPVMEWLIGQAVASLQ
jgi:DNA (cytosine-5)-methyltransferase 1